MQGESATETKTKEINFSLSQHENLYHTKVESDIKSNGQMIKGKARITGYSQQPIAHGTIFRFSKRETFVVEKVNEIRDHTGKFNNPEEAKNAYFDVTVSFERLIVQKK